MKTIQRFIDRWFGLEEINGRGLCPTYLYRWTLAKWRGRAVYLHHFVGDDWSRDLHDHPKRFISIGLWGGYIEQRMAPCWIEDSYHGGPIQQMREVERVYRAPWIRTFPAQHIHRLRLIDQRPCWTLVIVLKTVREWGFWSDGSWLPWRTYVRSDAAEQNKSC